MKTARIRKSGERLDLAHLRGIVRGMFSETALMDFAAVLSGVYLKAWDGVDSNGFPNGGGIMRTDGETIEVCEENCARYSDSHLAFILCHEAAHILANHSGRYANVHRRVFGKTDRNDADVKLSALAFNVAADYTINSELANLAARTKQLAIPEDALVCPDKYLRESTETIYRDLVRNMKKDPNGGEIGIGAPAWGGVTPNDSLNAGTGKQADIIQRAISLIKAMGKDAGNLEAILRGVTIQPENWYAVFKEYLKKAADELTWKKANRRSDMFPGKLPRTLRAMFYIDTSGSMSQPELTGIVGDLVHITSDMRVDCAVLQGDTRITDRKEYYAGEIVPYDLPIKGGGGTSFKPVLREAANGEYDLLVVFTDLVGDYSVTDDPGIPVLWVVTSDWKSDLSALFGEIITRPFDKPHKG